MIINLNAFAVLLQYETSSVFRQQALDSLEIIALKFHLKES